MSMIVFVPVFLYALFLDDLQRHAMEVQETVISTVWDFTGQNYMPSDEGAPDGSASIVGRVQNPARLTYCDHEAGLDSFDLSAPECEEENTAHHEALAGHVCWLHPGGKQVTCEGPRRNVGALPEATYSLYGEEHQRLGGMFVCSARAGVNNYLLPQFFLKEFSREPSLSKKNWRHDPAGNIHDKAKASGEDTAYYLPVQYAAILTDSWALTPGTFVNPDWSKGPFHSRMRTVFERNPAFASYRRSAEQFQTGLVQQRLLQRGAGDSLTVPHLAYTPVGERQGTGSAEPTTEVNQGDRTSPYFSTPWRDWERDGHAKTYEARGAYYLGCKSPDRC
ncbi:hypothetical protein ACLESO_26465 [Pyxidicoccus sp. 3LG]